MLEHPALNSSAWTLLGASATACSVQLRSLKPEQWKVMRPISPMGVMNSCLLTGAAPTCRAEAGADLPHQSCPGVRAVGLQFEDAEGKRVKITDGRFTRTGASAR